MEGGTALGVEVIEAKMSFGYSLGYSTPICDTILAGPSPKFVRLQHILHLIGAAASVDLQHGNLRLNSHG